MSAMERVSQTLKDFEEKSLLVLVIITLALIFANVLLRYGFNRTLTWAEELSRFLFIAITYIGASAGVRTKGHIVVDLLMVVFPKTRKALLLLSNLFAALFLLIIVVASVKYAYFLKSVGQTSTGLSIPMWIPYIGVILGSLMMLFRFQEVFVRTIRRNEQ